MLRKQKEYFQCSICLENMGISTKYTREALKNHMKTVHKPKIIGDIEK